MTDASRRLLFLLALVIAVASADAAPRRRAVAPGTGSPEAQWLRERAIPLDTVDPTIPADELRPLLDQLEGVEVITLGEGTHYTHEFQAVYHRLSRFLAEERGVRVFTFEWGWPEAFAIDEYVRTGVGDLEELLRDDVWKFWDTEEVRDLVLWARAWNESRPENDHIRLLGVDPWVVSRPKSHVTNYLLGVDPAAGTAAQSSLACLDSSFSEYSKRPAAAQQSCREAISGVANAMAANRSAYEAKSSARQFAAAARSAAMILQAEYIATGLTATDWEERRDEMAAANVLALRKELNASTVVFRGHNGHASAAGYWTGANLNASVGAYLREQLGGRLYAIATTSSRGTYHAHATAGGVSSFGVHPFPQPRSESWEVKLDAVGYPQMIVSFRPVAPEWTMAERPFFIYVGNLRFADATRYSPPTSLPQAFDAVIYVRDTTPSRLLAP